MSLRRIICLWSAILATSMYAGASSIAALSIAPQDAKQYVSLALGSRSQRSAEIAQQIWELAEVGYQEERSSKLLQWELEESGFTVESGVADIPTAFVATYGYDEPIVGILAEFDALPGLSQAAVPERLPLTSDAGHACGHHLFGTASTSAAIAVKEWLASTGTSGTIRLYGTPAEEGGAGKVYLARAGLFDDVDVALHWHPADRNDASPGHSLANKSAKFRFHGQSTHAASAPERGRSALDGVEAMNHMVNLMREHVPQETRIHYVITHGGRAPNVVPEFAEVYYYVRHPDVATVKELFERVTETAQGAALGTGTQLEYEIIHGIYNLLPNETLGRLMNTNLRQLGGVTYNDGEREFAEMIRPTLGTTDITLGSEAEIQPFEIKDGGGSTDVGDISWLVPTAGLAAATWVPGTSAHSWQAVAAGGTSIGTKGMLLAAETLAWTAVDLFRDPTHIMAARQELTERRGADFRYEALVGDRNPPLDYRQ